MEYAEDQINRYSSMMKMTFDEPSAMKEVQTTVLNSLIQQAIPEILTHKFDKLLDSVNTKRIRRMFDLCRQCVGGEDEVRNQFSKYMRQQGEKIIATCPDDDLVTELLTFKRKIDVISEFSQWNPLTYPYFQCPGASDTPETPLSGGNVSRMHLSRSSIKMWTELLN